MMRYAPAFRWDREGLGVVRCKGGWQPRRFLSNTSPMRATRLISSLLLFASLTVQAYVDPVTNREWRQLIDTRDVGVLAANAVCAGAGHSCQGSVNGIDLTGWTFAATDDVLQLFENFGFNLSFGGNYYAGIQPPQLVDQFVDRDGERARFRGLLCHHH